MSKAVLVVSVAIRNAVEVTSVFEAPDVIVALLEASVEVGVGEVDVARLEVEAVEDTIVENADVFVGSAEVVGVLEVVESAAVEGSDIVVVGVFVSVVGGLDWAARESGWVG